MTLDECASQYDVSIYYVPIKESDSKWTSGWKWDINGGYSSVGGSNGYSTPQNALNELLDYLETFNGFEK